MSKKVTYEDFTIVKEVEYNPNRGTNAVLATVTRITKGWFTKKVEHLTVTSLDWDFYDVKTGEKVPVWSFYKITRAFNIIEGIPFPILPEPSEGLNNG